MKLTKGTIVLLLVSLGCGDDDSAPTGPSLARLNA